MARWRKYTLAFGASLLVHIAIIFIIIVWLPRGDTNAPRAETPPDLGIVIVETMLVETPPAPPFEQTPEAIPAPRSDPEPPASLPAPAPEPPVQFTSPIRITTTIPAPMRISPAVPARSAPPASSRPTAPARTTRGPAINTSPATVGSAGSDSGPRPIVGNAKPGYPPESERAGELGVVTLSVKVSTTGTVTSVTIVKSSGFPRLDAAAQTTVRGWRFDPARAGGIAVPGAVIIPVRFRPHQRL